MERRPDPQRLDEATRPQLQELVQLLVERVQAKERVIDPATIEWTPPARPFFGEVRGYGAPDGSRGARPAFVIEGVSELVMELLAA